MPAGVVHTTGILQGLQPGNIASIAAFSLSTP
jgi:hypothetical protein